MSPVTLERDQVPYYDIMSGYRVDENFLYMIIGIF